MITIKEYLITKNNAKSKSKKNKVPVTYEELHNLVRYEIEQNGVDVDLNHIDVSQITNMSGLFKDTNFQGDVSLWDVENLSIGYQMFYGCDKFDCNLSDWKLNNLETAHQMFYRCKRFDCNVKNWKMQKLVNAKMMFQGCFNFKGNGIEKWNVKNLKDTELMFASCVNFNGKVSEWDITKLENGRGMFLNCKEFNQDLGKWNVDKMFEAENMFLDCSIFEGNGLDKWNTSHIRSMSSMFEGCWKLNIDLSSWKLENVDRSKARWVFNGCNKMLPKKLPIKWQK